MIIPDWIIFCVAHTGGDSMYFPYLRGRQFELIAIRELVSQKLIGGQVIPIIEPVHLTNTLIKTLEVCSSQKKADRACD